MSREDEFDSLNEWADAEDVKAANQRTLDLLTGFLGLVGAAVEQYPQGDLYEFLSCRTAAFAVYAVKHDLIRFEDVGSFFADCGFDKETVAEMVQDYNVALNPQPPLEPALAEEVEVYRKWSKRK
jgi:hypothetical protein